MIRIPETFIRSNLQGFIFITPEIILTLAIIILLVLAIVLPYERLRLFFTILAMTALACALGSLRLLPPSTTPVAFLFFYPDRCLYGFIEPWQQGDRQFGVHRMHAAGSFRQRGHDAFNGRSRSFNDLCGI